MTRGEVAANLKGLMREMLYWWDTGEKDVTPKGMAPHFAAPEVLQSYYSNFNTARRHFKQVEGPPADIYSAGVLLFQMLTGCVPFSADDAELADIEVPEKIPQHSRELWRRAAAVTKQQVVWVCARPYHQHTL